MTAVTSRKRPLDQSDGRQSTSSPLKAPKHDDSNNKSDNILVNAHESVGNLAHKHEQICSNPSQHISASTAISFWSSRTADIHGVLGGLPQLSRPDLRDSLDFLNSLRRESKEFPLSKDARLPRAVDCGAGIGRITLGLLSKVAEVVDIVEPIEKFTRVVSEGAEFEKIRARGGIGEIFNCGLEDWHPDTISTDHVTNDDTRSNAIYALIWNQWCLSQLSDTDLTSYLHRSKFLLLPGGWIIVKENLCLDPHNRDYFDPEDSSIRRTDENYRKIFAHAGLKVVKSRLQRGFPKEVFPVRMYALQPADDAPVADGGVTK